MKKGFTLVELLAVIILLGVVGLIAVPTVNSVIEKSRKRAHDMQIKEIEKAAKSWAANNLDALTHDSTYYLEVRTLINEGYISNEEVLDPADSNQYLDDCVRIVYISEYNNYDFKYSICTES